MFLEKKYFILKKKSKVNSRLLSKPPVWAVVLRELSRAIAHFRALILVDQISETN